MSEPGTLLSCLEKQRQPASACAFSTDRKSLPSSIAMSSSARGASPGVFWRSESSPAPGSRWRRLRLRGSTTRSSAFSPRGPLRSPSRFRRASDRAAARRGRSRVLESGGRWSGSDGYRRPRPASGGDRRRSRRASRRATPARGPGARLRRADPAVVGNHGRAPADSAHSPSAPRERACDPRSNSRVLPGGPLRARRRLLASALSRHGPRGRRPHRARATGPLTLMKPEEFSRAAGAVAPGNLPLPGHDQRRPQFRLRARRREGGR